MQSRKDEKNLLNCRKRTPSGVVVEKNFVPLHPLFGATAGLG